MSGSGFSSNSSEWSAHEPSRSAFRAPLIEPRSSALALAPRVTSAQPRGPGERAGSFVIRPSAPMLMASPVSSADLLPWLASLPPGARDRAVEEYLGIGGPAPPDAPAGEHLVGYHPSGVAAIVQAL